MAKTQTSDTNLTIQVKNLSNKIYGHSILKDSVLDRAIKYFHSLGYLYKERDKYSVELAALSKETENVSEEEITSHKKKIVQLERDLRAEIDDLDVERKEREKHLLILCHDIIELCDGGLFEDNNRKSAQILATIQLLSPTEGKQIATANEQSKPLYKGILCLRLLDRLCLSDVILDSYIKERLEGIPAEQYNDFSTINPEAYQRFIDEVKVPLLMAALLQDIGNHHPDAQLLLKGEDGQQDPHRMLELEDRKALLQINYRETVRYLVEGIGARVYVGNSKPERELFNKAERAKLLFIKRLIKSSINPKQSIGNLLKVPQIYTSMIISTKPNYNYKLLPKVYQVLNQNAERGSCSQIVVDALHTLTGDFPLGYGVVYIPNDSDGRALDRYEYAIVNRLYPEKRQEPKCRIASRNLTFINHGQDIVITNDNNLNFAETGKKLASISKERLNEILELLASNYAERQKLDLLPRCWHPKDYFSIKDNQKLWNK
ncbi:MAG: hypothetical protein HRT52_18615 [Colwellia sp.]|nr:hypothetical protein [Colwellia sp.]